MQEGALLAQFEGHHNMTIFKIFENIGASVNDYLVIAVGADGDTVIETADGAGADANLTFTVDGVINLNAVTGVRRKFVVTSSTDGDYNGDVVYFGGTS